MADLTGGEYSPYNAPREVKSRMPWGTIAITIVIALALLFFFI